MTHPGGRPTKYKPEMCQQVIELGGTGASKTEIYCTLGIHHDTFAEWQKLHLEFSAAVKQAEQSAMMWWEQKGRLATFGGTDGFNATAFIFQMKNRFKEHYRDKTETEHSAPGGAGLFEKVILEHVHTKASDTSKDS